MVQIVAKSLLILMNKGDMVAGERLTPQVEREREKLTTCGKQTASRLENLIFNLPWREQFNRSAFVEPTARQVKR